MSNIIISSKNDNKDQTVHVTNKIPYGKQWIDDDDIHAVESVLKAEFLTQGPQIEIFERALSSATHNNHSIVVSNGTAGLHIACQAMGVNNGSICITSPITFAATANAILYCQGTPIFVDVDPVTGIICLDSLKKLLQSYSSTLKNSPHVNMILPVDFAGRPCHVQEIYHLSQQYNLKILRDSAHNIGGFYQHTFPDTSSRETLITDGDYNDACILSFHPVKHICCGEGGAVVTNDDSLAKRLRQLRTHGITRDFSGNHSSKNIPGWYYEQVELGWNYRMTDIQAALGISQLKKLPFFLNRRRILAQQYTDIINQSFLKNHIKLPLYDPGHAYHIFIVHFENEAIRNAVYDFLKLKNIFTQLHYIPVYRHPYYEKSFGKQRLPGAELYYKGCLSLPLYPQLTDEDQLKVIYYLEEFFQK